MLLTLELLEGKCQDLYRQYYWQMLGLTFPILKKHTKLHLACLTLNAHFN